MNIKELSRGGKARGEVCFFWCKKTLARHIRRIFDDNDLILRIECVYTKNWRNGGKTAATAENRHFPPKYWHFQAILEHLALCLNYQMQKQK